MDWSKAKTYLIFTFFLLDLLLGYQYYAVCNVEAGTVQSFEEQMAEVRDLLQSRNLILGTDVPKETPELGFLRVRYAQVDPKRAASKLLKNPQLVDTTNSHPSWVQYQGDKGTFTYKGSGELLYDVTPMHITLSPDDPKIFDRLYAEIGTFVWNPLSFGGDRVIKQGENDATVRYVQMYQNYPIFSAPIHVTLQNGQVTLIQQSALEIIGEEGNKKPVISAVSALRSLAESMDKSTVPEHNRVIRDIRLGYFSKPFNTDSWYLAPMWRITTDQNVYFVNGMTGELETVR
jgi:regulatory protein YycI of two-component signal transduction system YycFG